jgi:uncharacterized membrane protein YfcA
MFTSDVSTEIFLLLFVSTMVTSAFTAVLGHGGGLLLMGVLAQVLPPMSLVAIHAVIQGASNSSRALLSIKEIDWKIISPILVGIVLGALLVSPFIETINWDWMQIFIALFILWTVWGKGLKLNTDLPFALTTLGIFQGSLGLLLGATGPLGNAILLAKGLSRERLIASNAVIMFVSHAVKIIVFLILGTVLSQYISLLIALSVAAILGSYFGKLLRPILPEALFFKIFKLSLTFLALRMLYLGFISLS